jgi:hypothetical protein
MHSQFRHPGGEQLVIEGRLQRVMCKVVSDVPNEIKLAAIIRTYQTKGRCNKGALSKG